MTQIIQMSGNRTEIEYFGVGVQNRNDALNANFSGGDYVFLLDYIRSLESRIVHIATSEEDAGVPTGEAYEQLGRLAATALHSDARKVALETRRTFRKSESGVEFCFIEDVDRNAGYTD
jgi:hypothetical protein